jgi:hypothetical protein
MKVFSSYVGDTWFRIKWLLMSQRERYICLLNRTRESRIGVTTYYLRPVIARNGKQR